MLLDKYAPAGTKDIIGNRQAIEEIKRFLANWRKGRALLVHGPPGCGKSLAVRLIAKENGYDLVEAQPDEVQDPKELISTLKQRGVFSKKRIMLFENLETARSIKKIADESSHPVICTINDAYQLPPALRKSFRILKFERPNKSEVLRFLEGVCNKEGINCSKREVEQLARTSNGDLRSLLIDLEAFKSNDANQNDANDVTQLASVSQGFKYGGYRDAEESVFNALKIIFKTMSIANAKIAMDSSKDSEELFRWLEENIAEEYQDTESIAIAYDYLSKADLFRSRIIRRQQWNMQKYFPALAVYGAALAKKRPSVRFIAYKRPIFVKYDNTALKKIARQLHVSTNQAYAYMPILRMLARKGNILEELGLDEKETSFILGE